MTHPNAKGAHRECGYGFAQFGAKRDTLTSDEDSKRHQCYIRTAEGKEEFYHLVRLTWYSRDRLKAYE